MEHRFLNTTDADIKNIINRIIKISFEENKIKGLIKEDEEFLTYKMDEMDFLDYYIGIEILNNKLYLNTYQARIGYQVLKNFIDINQDYLLDFTADFNVEELELKINLSDFRDDDDDLYNFKIELLNMVYAEIMN